MSALIAAALALTCLCLHAVQRGTTDDDNHDDDDEVEDAPHLISFLMIRKLQNVQKHSHIARHLWL